MSGLWGTGTGPGANLEGAGAVDGHALARVLIGLRADGAVAVGALGGPRLGGFARRARGLKARAVAVKALGAWAPLAVGLEGARQDAVAARLEGGAVLADPIGVGGAWGGEKLRGGAGGNGRAEGLGALGEALARDAPVIALD